MIGLDTCGHRCLAKCHSESMHEVFPCPQPCERLLDSCNHSCPKACSEKCGNCMIKVDDIPLPCGHIKDSIRCYQTLDIEMIKCSASVEKEVPTCKHKVEFQCYQDPSSFPCPVPCTEILEGRHSCKGTCGRCRETDSSGQETIKHTTCSVVCGRNFGSCSYSCSQKCHIGSGCGLCMSPCEVSNSFIPIQVDSNFHNFYLYLLRRSLHQNFV